MGVLEQLSKALALRPQASRKSRHHPTSRRVKEVNESQAASSVRREKKTFKPASFRFSYEEARCDLVGLVMPMGHGKSTLAQEEGWIDFDSLINPRHRRQLQEEVYNEIARGSSVWEAMQLFVPEARKTLALIRPAEKWLVLAPDRRILEALGIACGGGLVVDATVVDDANKHRPYHERQLMRVNAEEVYRDLESFNGCMVARDYSDARQQLYEAALALNMPVSRPLDFGLHDPTLRTDVLGRSERVDLDVAASLADKGLASAECVSYQVQLQGLRHYKGYGYTPDKWAKTMSRVTAVIGDDTYSDQDWVAGPITLESLSTFSDIAEQEDVQFILSAQKGEHPRFICSLILHWKGLAMNIPMAKRLLPLYGVRRAHWRWVMSAIQEAVLASGTYMGTFLTTEETELLSCMYSLSCGRLGEVCSSMSGRRGYPCPAPCHKTEEKVNERMERVLFEKEYDALAHTNLSVLLRRSKCKSLEAIEWMSGDDPGLSTRAQSLAYFVGLELCEAWGDCETSLKMIPVIMHKIISKWYKVSIVRDEWSDFLGRILDFETTHHGMAKAVAHLVRCPPQEAAAGSDWGIRVIEAIKGLVVCGIVVSGDEQVVVQKEGSVVSPGIYGVSEGTIWARIIASRIPKHALGSFGGAMNPLALANDLCRWKDSMTLILLEMVNQPSWARTLSRKEMLVLLHRWGSKTIGRMEPVVRSFMLDSYSKELLGHSYKRIEGRLEVLANMRTADGGLGCIYNRCNKGTVQQVDEAGVWLGSGRVELINTRVRIETKNLDTRVAEFMSHEFNFKSSTKKTSVALHIGGLAVCHILNDQGKTALNSNAIMLEYLAAGGLSSC